MLTWLRIQVRCKIVSLSKPLKEGIAYIGTVYIALLKSALYAFRRRINKTLTIIHVRGGMASGTYHNFTVNVSLQNQLGYNSN